MKYDVYEMATEKICAMLEQGFIPWVRPWTNDKTKCAWSRQTGKEYSLLNQFLLANPEKKYKSFNEILEDVSGEWLTFNQIKELGGHVKKGEKGRWVIFFKWLEKETEKTDEDGNTIKEKIPCLQRYFVYKTTQCQNIENKHHNDDGKTYDFTHDATADEVAQSYLKREKITLEHTKQNRAYYSTCEDKIVMPNPEQFKDSKEYYSTLFHEITHSTGHEKRLNRISKNSNFGNEEYSLEELTAEIGSASILATLGIDTQGTLRNSAGYIQSWLKVLKNNKKMIVYATARAEKAIKKILNIEENESKIAQ